MPKTISVSVAKNELSAMLEWAVKNRDGVIVESYGQPKAVILSYADYQTYLSLQEKERRRAAIARLQELAIQNRARNRDLSPDEAEQLADQITRDTIDRMVEEGKVTFQ